MLTLTISEIMEATGGQLVSGNAEATVTGISTDSRKIDKGYLFIPLTGERFNGHDYINKAFDEGAAATLTQQDESGVEGRRVIRVGDTSRALRDLAAWYREKFSVPFVGITGSVGKTSTKDMIACVVGSKLNVLKTEGNLNNEIGVPLTIFNLNGTHEAAVLEMGMSGTGEIGRLTAIIKPDIAVITNIGISHIEKLGSRQNILKAKLEILEALNPDGLVILNGDDALLAGMKDLLKFRTVLYGMDEGVDYRACNINSHGESGTFFDITLGGREYNIHIPVPGVHNVHNALAAVAVGCELGIPMEDIIRGIAGFSPSKMRMDIVSFNCMKIINDVYNASPNSMEAGINVLREIGRENRKIAVLGDMLELGEWSEKAHFDMGKYASAAGIDRIIAVGSNARFIADGALSAGYPEEQIRYFQSNAEALDYLQKTLVPGDVILVKGSRGMKMEEIVKGLANTIEK
ncbi:MAG: UDP-N-acetylmuramoyl-tripeptide--D-alanyl-D-alanine ligase [Ruminiclostridium sp.]|nr:UDP-N-acetylmuramoyl-tripeptide--D-alanyl-D-alanine ligase [Ruminiclostridium sp.]